MLLAGSAVQNWRMVRACSDGRDGWADPSLAGCWNCNCTFSRSGLRSTVPEPLSLLPFPSPSTHRNHGRRCSSPPCRPHFRNAVSPTYYPGGWARVGFWAGGVRQPRPTWLALLVLRPSDLPCAATLNSRVSLTSTGGGRSCLTSLSRQSRFVLGCRRNVKSERGGRRRDFPNLPSSTPPSASSNETPLAIHFQNFIS